MVQGVDRATTTLRNVRSAWVKEQEVDVQDGRGRQFLADLLMQLSDAQLHDMFEAAHVELRPRVPTSGRSGFTTVEERVDAFKQKRDQIVERRCH